MYELGERQRIEAMAWDLIRVRRERPMAEVPRRERRDNARTALMEALTASGHLSRVEIGGSLEEINHQVLSRLLNGWDESLPLHERQRRFAELCNELVIQETQLKIVSGELPEDTSVVEVSDYPLALDDETATSLGYRRGNRKGMVRSTHLRRDEDGGYTRIIEQVSRSNGTPASTFRFYKAAGVPLEKGVADVAVLSAPFRYSSDRYVDGVVDVMRRLDKQDVNQVLYGDTPDKATRHAPYEELREESFRREAEIESYIDDLADLEEQLDALRADGDIDETDRLVIFKEEVDRILTAICTLEPAYAEDTFGTKAAPCFAEAGQLYALGQGELASRALAEAHLLKEVVTFCGMSLTVEQAQQQKGLKVNDFLSLLEKGRENWKWKKGICQVKECPSRPAKTEVGPCSVCRKCQKIFDKGEQPKDVYKVTGILGLLFGSGNKKNT